MNIKSEWEMAKRICRALQNYPVYKSVAIPFDAFDGYRLDNDQIHEQMKKFHGKIHSYRLDRDKGYLYMRWETTVTKEEGDEYMQRCWLKGK